MIRLAAYLFLPIAGLGSVSTAAAMPSGSLEAHKALVLCRQADDMTAAQRDEVLSGGLVLAKHAASLDDRDAAAHFAIFCNLGKQIRFAGLSWSGLRHLHQLRTEIDRTLELVPDDPDALTAKGELLLELPGIFGGDSREGTRLLERALAMDPANQATQMFLTRVAP